VQVNEDLTLPGHPEIFVVGDMMALNNLPVLPRSPCRAASMPRSRSSGG
jgi:NADH dehydrogenase